ncbi:MAG: segregation/condensation protein A [Clostridia bacterium]
MEKLSFKLTNFEGPLDMLLQLISKNKINIYDIPITIILEQYLEQIDIMQKENLEVTADFLTMAAQLVYIKSKTLLPSEENNEEEDPRDTLVRMLVEYKRYKDVSSDFKAVTFGMNNIFTKKPDKVELDNKYVKSHEISEIEGAYKDILRKVGNKLPPPQSSFKDIVGHVIVSVASRAVNILRKLLKTSSIKFKSLFENSKSRSEIVATFLAVLELSKSDNIEIDDNISNPTIKIKRKKAK